MARLDQVFPRETGLPWLLPVWECGDPWAPIERWVIYVMMPLALMAPAHREAYGAELKGPNPRSTGHYCASGHCACDLKANRWIGGQTTLIDYWCWRLFQRHGAYGTRFWIVQGDTGGHPRRFDTIEQQMAAARKLPDAPPTIGDLPYAPLDERVITALVRRDRLRDAKGTLRNTLLSAEGLRAEDEARAQAAAEQLFEWFDTQFDEGTDRLAWALQQDFSGTVMGRHGDAVRPLDRDAFREDFVRDTAVLASST